MIIDDFYTDLYSCFYKFCNTDIPFDVKSLQTEFNECSNTGKKKKGKKYLNKEERFLTSLYELVDVAVSHKKDEFNAKYGLIEKTLTTDEHRKKWMLYSIVCVAYEYIFSDEGRLAYITGQKEEEEKYPDSILDIMLENDVCEITRHHHKPKIAKNEYLERFYNRDYRMQTDSFLMILKGFSSSSPFFYPALRERFHHVPIRGGGIFLKWKECGIAVDPGINFMENMHRNGLFIQDINAVIVTHNHIDHNGDIATIDDLASQFSRKDIKLYCDHDTSGNKNNIANFCGIPHTLDMEKDYFDINENIRLYFIQTEHMKIGYDSDEYIENKSFAVKLILSDSKKVKKIIGYTSDTCYMDALPEFFKDCDYVIANISETNEEDYKGIKPKDTHMGYNGCFRLIGKIKTTATKKTVFILSEFWAGKGDIRKELVKRLRYETGYSYIYPGDIGMMFFLDNKDRIFRCSQCRYIKPLEKLQIIRNGGEYSPFITICSDCIL